MGWSGGCAAAAVALATVATVGAAVTNGHVICAVNCGASSWHARAWPSPVALRPALAERSACHSQHLCSALGSGHQKRRTQLAAKGGDEVVFALAISTLAFQPQARAELFHQPLLQLHGARAEHTVCGDDCRQEIFFKRQIDRFNK